jgi:PKD repeat protein
MKFFIRILLFFISYSSVIAQTGREFWFGAPDISTTLGDEPAIFHVTAMYKTTVTISMPANSSFEPITLYLEDNEHQSIDLSDYLTSSGSWETTPTGSIQPKGFLFRSEPGEITVYYELNHLTNNRDIAPLKGANALGTQFTVSTQNYLDSYRPGGAFVEAKSGMVIVATQDTTNVTIFPNGNHIYFHTMSPINLVLNKGETYAIRNDNGSDDAEEHLNGIEIVSDKKIAVTTYDVGIVKSNDDFNMMIDQVVPENILGTEFFIQRGYTDDSLDIAFITGTVNGTTLTINGIPVGTVDKDSVFQYFLPLSMQGASLTTSNPVFINHLTGKGKLIAGATLPSFDDCIGSYEVVFTRTPEAKDKIKLRLIAQNETNPASPYKNKAADNFYYIINYDTTKIQKGYFKYSYDSSYIYLPNDSPLNNDIIVQFTRGETIRIFNKIAKFHFGTIMGGDANAPKYGYVTDYTDMERSAGIGGFTYIKNTASCSLDPVRLVAAGGTEYHWDSPSNPLYVNMLSNDSVAAPYFYPDSGGVYTFRVTISSPCYALDKQVELTVASFIMPSSDFTVSEYSICSGDSITITNTSNNTYTDTMEWVFSPPDTTLYHTSLQTFNWSFQQNSSNTVQKYLISLTSYSPGKYCYRTREKEISVKPFVDVSIDADTTIGCAPLDIQFINNTTSGHNTDTALIYDWDLGNGNYPSSKNPFTIYSNNTPTDSLFRVTLKAETPYGCTDSDTLYIDVLPRVQALFSIDTNYSCSPLVAHLDPSGSLNADSLYWKYAISYDLMHKDSTSATDILDPDTLVYWDNTWLTGPDTITITLVAKNSYGCIDTSSAPELIVYPNIVADFTIDDDSICDGDTITFTNNSHGYHPRYEWTFGDNTTRKDTIEVLPFGKPYFNRSESDTTYHIILRAVSEGICDDIMDTNLVVHPYIKAEFGYDFDNDGKNCAPVNAIIDNNSIRVDTYDWDFGDGSPHSSDGSSVITHLFNNANKYTDTTYTIRLLVSNNQGCSDSLSRDITILPEVVAAFTILETNVCAPDTVHFSNQSTGSNLKYYWDFGDKQTSMDTDSTFTWYYENYFDNDTNYTIQLIVENNINCTDTLEKSVEAFATVESLFGATEKEGCSPFTVELDNFSSPSAKVYHWDLGSAGLSTNFIPTPFPEYTNTSLLEDTILIKLAVAGVDDAIHWNTCSDTFSIPVVVYPELHVDFSLSDTADCQPLNTTITNNTALTDGTTYTWELDNIFLSNKPAPGTITIKNVTADSAIHRISLFGKSKHNCPDSISHDVVVYSLVKAEFSIDKEALCTYDSLYIDRTSSEGGITSYEWDFNGEESFTDSIPAFYYSHFDNPLPGNTSLVKTVTLTAKNAHNCSSTYSDSILVYPTIKAAFTLDTHKICYPHTSVFTNGSDNSNYFSWEFGDGISSTEVSPEHLFGNFSTEIDSVYNIRLISGSLNCYDTAYDKITIYAKPSADFYFPVTADCPPFETKMINQSKGDAPTFYWDFAGEGNDNIENPTWVFTNPTNLEVEKTITLEVYSQNGCSDTMQKNITVYPNVDTNFTTSINQGCSPLSVQFESKADPTNIQQILWLVDDNAFANITNPTYRFENKTPDNDTFNVKFKVYSTYNCSDSAMTSITVYPSPVVNFIPDPITNEYNTQEDQTTITISNETVFQDNWEYLWDFGDGNTNNNTEQEFSYSYGDRVWGDAENNNRIPITLTGWNPDNPECRDSIQYNIIITPPEPEIDIFEDVTGCQPLTVDFSAYTKYNYDSSYFWEFNAAGATSTEENPTFTFMQSGSYTVRLTVKGDGGPVSDYKIVNVFPQPEADFSFNDTIVFVESDEVIFYNHTANGVNYMWYFDADNICTGVPGSSEFEPVHTFQDTGVYHIALIAESEDQCLDTMIHPTPILVLELGELEFPNAFLVSPGSISDEYSTNQAEDGGNVYLFYPKHLNVVEYHLQLYSRWGTLIFESFDINRGWNGMFDGQPAEQGVYLWRARGRFANGQPFDKSGDVTLIKGKRE